MFVELIELMLECLNALEFLERLKELNEDDYPKNFVEIDGELVEYGDQT